MLTSEHYDIFTCPCPGCHRPVTFAQQKLPLTRTGKAPYLALPSPPHCGVCQILQAVAKGRASYAEMPAIGGRAPAFSTGRVHILPGAVGCLNALKLDPLVLVRRHQAGDFGELGALADADPAVSFDAGPLDSRLARNALAIRRGAGSIVSAYDLFPKEARAYAPATVIAMWTELGSGRVDLPATVLYAQSEIQPPA